MYPQTHVPWLSLLLQRGDGFTHRLLRRLRLRVASGAQRLEAVLAVHADFAPRGGVAALTAGHVDPRRDDLVGGGFDCHGGSSEQSPSSEGCGDSIAGTTTIMGAMMAVVKPETRVTMARASTGNKRVRGLISSTKDERKREERCRAQIARGVGAAVPLNN